MNILNDNMLMVLIFVVIVLVILSRVSVVILLLVASILTNIALIYPDAYANASSLLYSKLDLLSHPQPAAVTPDASSETFMVNENPIEYTNERTKYIAGYTLAYDKPRPIPGLGFDENTHNIDNMNTMQWRERGTRDKKRSDGWATKDANYYRYHFADELNYEENKVWHGRNDY